MSSLEKRINDTCVRLYTELSSIDTTDDCELTLQHVLNFSPQAGLNFINETLQELLVVKRSFAALEEYRGFEAEKQYQNALQKLESEVRHHIKIEQQLKLLLESSQSKLEESKKKAKVVLEKQRKENVQLTEKLREVTQSLSQLKGKSTELSVARGQSTGGNLKLSTVDFTNREFQRKTDYLKLNPPSRKPEAKENAHLPPDTDDTYKTLSIWRRMPLVEREGSLFRSAKKVKVLKRPLSSQSTSNKK